MRLRNKPWAAGELAACKYYIKEPNENFGRWQQQFANDNPIWLEVGCGKGLFVAGYAPKMPQVNFIAADIKSLMLAYARRYIDAAFGDRYAGDNVRLLSLNAMQLGEAFAESDKVQRIYINFCNPWPKDHHKKRRLTHPRQLELYKKILSADGSIHFKTDDDNLYEESVEYFKQCGFTLKQNLWDYYSVEHDGLDVKTEHEQMFLSQGLPIHYIEAVIE